MTKGEFYASFLRLVKKFDTDKNGNAAKKLHYPPEVMRLIFNEVEMLSIGWFDTLVTKILATERFAPLLPVFQDHAKSERRRTKPSSWSSPGTSTLASIYTDEERKEMLELGKQVARGLMSADLANEYIDKITSIANERNKE